MIDNNIVQSLGVGSGIDTNNLVRQLVDIEKAAPQARIDSKKELAESRISDFGLLSSALSTLQDAAEVLTEPEALYSKTASFTESDALVPVELDTDVQSGTYSFNVSQVAQAHTLAVGGFSSTDDAVGEGTLTFRFGEWGRETDTLDADFGEITGAFTEGTTDSFVVTIDANNNSLEGLRDAINLEDKGVVASIVFDGSNYNLSLVSSSGAGNELEITAAESGGSPTNDDTSDLSRFAFNTSTQTFNVSNFRSVDAQKGQDAELTLNGISISRSNNTIDDVIEGLTFDVLKTMTASEQVTITISDDKAFAEQNVRTFVESYNAFLEAVEPAFGINDVEGDDGETVTEVGSLANDALAKSLLSQIRNVISSSIPGLSADATYNALTNVGIRTELDGTLSIDEDDFSEAFTNNFEAVQKVFAPFTSTSDNDVYINSYNDNTTAGEYTVAITQVPTKGLYEGTAVTFPLVISDSSYTFTVDVNGTESASLTVPTGTYTTGSELASAIQSLINTDSTISDAGHSVTVNYDGGLDITSDTFGSGSNVTVISPSANTSSNLGLAAASGTAGVAAGGTIDSVTGFGSSNVLLPALGQPGEGLALVVDPGASTSQSITVNFSRGFAGELDQLIDSFLASDGVVATRTDTLEDSIENFDGEQDRLDRRIAAYEERILNQFIAMERIINSLNTSGSFLDNLINTLPFTAGNNDN